MTPNDDLSTLGVDVGRLRVTIPGRAPRDARFQAGDGLWSLAVQDWDASSRPVTATGTSRDGFAVLSALCGMMDSRASAPTPPAAAADPPAEPVHLVIDHSVAPPPRPSDWYRPPTDAEIARVLRGFDYRRIKAELPGKWVIAYSLYGDNPLYTVGALKNAMLGPRVFPEFVSRFYYGASVPSWIIETLRQLPQVELIDMTDQPEGPRAMFWRFLAPSDPDVDVYLCRDTDSRLTVRDRAAVNEWLASGKAFHIMRDAAAGAHNAYMVGCMWGSRGHALRDVRQLIREAGEYPDVKGVDQEFLWSYVYPRALKSAMIHDECTQIEPADFDAKRPFPTPMRDPWDRAALVIGADDQS